MIRFSNSRIPMGRDNRLEVKNLTLNSGELWVIAGPGGSGKSSMARAIAGVPDAAGYHIPVPGLTRRSPHNDKDGGAWVSFDSEREIRDLLRHNDDSEVLGRPDEGTSLDSFIGGRSGKAYLNPKLLKKLNGRGIKNLSTGEFRQVFIAREAGKNPALAVLDEPFEGLDKIARSRLIKQLGEWSESETLIVLTVNRLEDIPIFATGLIFLDGKQMIAMGPPSELLENPTVITLFKRSFPVNVKQTIPAAPENSGFQGDSLIEMKKVSLSFNGRSILENINWIVKPGESWLLTGPNGSGKTTLLNLISGNEPRGFGQNLNLFGRKKGSGETTAEIKGQIGQVSAAMQDSISRNSNPI
ncbi:MAG: ATP-binding cassette domain-containing protein, partial [Spirochaetaceae bacterium]|nr:ATP-binding cassette domain-containing protein [Spirochaetaceae bacterium]